MIIEEKIKPFSFEIWWKVVGLKPATQIETFWGPRLSTCNNPSLILDLCEVLQKLERTRELIVVDVPVIIII